MNEQQREQKLFELCEEAESIRLLNGFDVCLRWWDLERLTALHDRYLPEDPTRWARMSFEQRVGYLQMIHRVGRPQALVEASDDLLKPWRIKRHPMDGC